MSDTEPRPKWADSVAAFASASNRSTMVNSAPPIQFPSTGQLGGVCGNLLGGSAMTSGLAANGDPSQGQVGALVGGSQGFADSFCGMMGGDGVGTSPQSIHSGAQDVHSAVTSHPMAAGTIEMGQPDGPTGNTALDAINGLQNISDQMYSILAGCGCAPEMAPSSASPQAIIDQTQATADAVNANPMASGVIALGQTPSGSGNVALDALNGGLSFADSLYNIFNACGCGGVNAPSNATPGQIVDQTQATADKVMSVPMASGVIALGQTPSGSGNVAIDAVNGGQTLANNMFGLLSPCSCGGGFHPDTATPNTVYAAAQDTADAISTSPVGSTMLTLGQSGGSSGNVATDLVWGADEWFTGVNAVATTAGGTATAAKDTADQAATAAANVAAAVAQQQAAAIANDRIGGDYTTLVPVGSDGATLPSGWTGEGPAANDVRIRGGYGFAGIDAGMPAGTYWATPAFTYETDAQFMAVVLGDEGGATDAPITLHFHCDAGITVGAYLKIVYNGLELGSFTQTGGVFTYIPFPSGGLSMLLLSGQTVGVQNLANTYTVLVNGQPVLTYVGGSVVMNSTHRHAAVSMARVLH